MTVTFVYVVVLEALGAFGGLPVHTGMVFTTEAECHKYEKVSPSGPLVCYKEALQR